MLVAPSVPIASCQIAVAPGGVARLLLLGGETRGLVLVAVRFGICGFSACSGDALPVCADGRREALASGSSLLGEVWAQSPWLAAAPLRLLNLLLTAGKTGREEDLAVPCCGAWVLVSSPSERVPSPFIPFPRSLRKGRLSLGSWLGF